ncbi:MAG: 50S ribosomal protein L15 [Patescibacteria group bacterium]
MDLSKLPKITERKAKRKGRGLGSGKGSKSGRGTTRHQAARESIPLHFEGGQGRLVKRFPLLRGKGKNKSRNIKPAIIKLSALNVFNDGDSVDMKALVDKGLVDAEIRKVKILDDSGLKKKLTVGLSTSKAAKAAIIEAGGKVEVK